MSQFTPGDKVLIQGEVATIEVYDPDSNIVVYTTEIGGAENKTTAHVSNTVITALDGSHSAGGGGPVDIFGDPLEALKMQPNLINEDGSINPEATLG